MHVRRAVVLVGGQGTRLRPLTNTRPKQMLPICGVTMIERVVGHIASHGVEEIVLSMGYRPDAFVDAFPDGEISGVKVRYAVEDEPLDTAGAIRFAAIEAGYDKGDAFVVHNGDNITALDISALVAFHRNRRALATIALTRVDDPSAFGVVPTEPDGRVTGFIEKPPRDEAPTDWINAGTYVFEPELLTRIPDGRKVSVEREIFPGVAADGRLYAFQSDAYWIDAGTPFNYLEVQLDLLGDAVEIASTAKVDSSATVEQSVVGPGCVVGAGAVVRQSVLLPGTEIGAGAHVHRSVVGEGCTVGAGARLEQLTVLGDGTKVAAGSIVVAELIG